MGDQDTVRGGGGVADPSGLLPREGLRLEDVDSWVHCSATASIPRGLTDARTWQQLTDRDRRHGRLLGTDPSASPADFPVFVRYSKAVKSLPEAITPWRAMAVADAISGLTADPRLTVQR